MILLVDEAAMSRQASGPDKMKNLEVLLNHHPSPDSVKLLQIFLRCSIYWFVNIQSTLCCNWPWFTLNSSMKNHIAVYCSSDHRNDVKFRLAAASETMELHLNQTASKLQCPWIDICQSSFDSYGNSSQLSHCSAWYRRLSWLNCISGSSMALRFGHFLQEHVTLQVVS